MSQIKFVHTNIIARDWRKLAAFYQQVFGCIPVFPERNLLGEWLDRATGLTNAEIRGIHLRLPGYGDTGPTLEIFQYSDFSEGRKPAINRPGLAHIAFVVGDVQTVCDAVIKAGGGTVGDIVSTEIVGAGKITFVYVTDPEGNIIELQKWTN